MLSDDSKCNYIILDILLKWFAPILSFTTEEIYQFILKKEESIHLKEFVDLPKEFENETLFNKWRQLLEIRDICNLSIEEKRASKEIGSSLEASLIVKLGEKKLPLVKGIDLSELCITSSAKVINHENEDIIVETVKAEGKKCPVCWKISETKCKRHSSD